MAALVFLLAAVCDYLSLAYFLAAQKRQRARAIALGVTLTVIINLSVIFVVDNNWMLLPEAAGTAVGIWLALGNKKAPSKGAETKL